MKKTLKTLLAAALMLPVLLTPVAFGSAAGPCTHDWSFIGSWWTDGQICHAERCSLCFEMTPETPCVFDSPNPAAGDLCTICNAPYWEFAGGCDEHVFSSWDIRQDADGTLRHSRFCVECYHGEEGACVYNGGTVCLICGWDSEDCATCGGTYTLSCGGNAFCGDPADNCDDYTRLTVANDVTFGFCDCGCDVKDIVLMFIGWIEDGDWEPEDGEVILFTCDDNCSCGCEWDCPDCELSPPRTTATSPKTGDSVFPLRAAALTAAALTCFVIILVRRTKLNG